MIWSIMPIEMLQQVMQQTNVQYVEVDYNNTHLIAQKINEQECQIIRIISTNPNDYLKADLQPGEILNYHL